MIYRLAFSLLTNPIMVNDKIFILVFIILQMVSKFRIIES